MAYIYEHIRTQGYEPIHIKEHYARLDELSRRLFLRPLAVSEEELRVAIGEALCKEGLSPLTMNAVEVQISVEGEMQISSVEFIYPHFSLRALRSEGYICRLSGELLTENTSAKRALLELQHSTSQITNEGVAIWVNEADEVLSIDGAPAVAVFDNEIRFSRMGRGVEFALAQRVAVIHNRRITNEEITLADIAHAKELLSIDYRGVSALERVGNHRYMDITAEKIAAQVAAAEQQ